jgi:hypothetical protein
MVPRVNGEEIQALVRERLVEEVVVKTDGWQGYSFLDGSPRRHEWLVPGSGKEAANVLPWVHTLDRQYQGQYSWCASWRQSKALALLPGGILLPLQPSILGTAKVQPDASCLLA